MGPLKSALVRHCAAALSASVLLIGVAAGAFADAASVMERLVPLDPDRKYSAEELHDRMPQIGAIPGVELEWVARRMNNNGLPMQVQQLTSDRPVDEVVAAYKRRLERLGAIAPMERGQGRFVELYGGLGPYFFRIQVADAEGVTRGYVSVIAQPTVAETGSKSDFPVPGSVEVESHLAYGDGSDPAETLLGRSEQPPGMVVNDFRSELEAEGWVSRGMGAEGEMPPAMREGGRMLYERDGQWAQVLIVRKRDRRYRSMVMVHWRKRP